VCGESGRGKRKKGRAGWVGTRGRMADKLNLGCFDPKSISVSVPAFRGVIKGKG